MRRALRYTARLAAATLCGAAGMVLAGVGATWVDRRGAKHRGARRTGEVLQGHIIAEFEQAPRKYRRAA